MNRHASKEALLRVSTQMRMIGATSYQLSKGEIPELAKVLFPDEIIHAFMFGFYDAGYGLIVATNQRVVFIDKRFYNLKVEDLLYSVINIVEYHIGIFFGKATIYNRGEDFHFRWVKKSDMLRFCEYVDMKIQKG